MLFIIAKQARDALFSFLFIIMKKRKARYEFENKCSINKLKGLVQPKVKILSVLLTLMLFQPHKNFIHLWNIN